MIDKAPRSSVPSVAGDRFRRHAPLPADRASPWRTAERPRATPQEAKLDEHAWNRCCDVSAMLRFLQSTGRANKRKVRLFSCACVRQVWPLLTDDRSRRAVEAAELYADGLESKVELETARRAANNATRRLRRVCSKDAGLETAWAAAMAAGWTTGSAAVPFPANADDRKVQCDLLRDLFGPLPFRGVPVDPKWLAWNDATVVKIAQAIYEERRCSDLPILADALEDAGCDNEEVLSHCRAPGPHVRGCWALDLLLGKA